MLRSLPVPAPLQRSLSLLRLDSRLGTQLRLTVDVESGLVAFLSQLSHRHVDVGKPGAQSLHVGKRLVSLCGQRQIALRQG